MSDRINNTKQYLLNNDSISKQDKEYTLSFCKKMEYLEQLKQAVINDLHETVNSGYGNVNSNICFVFESEEDFQLLKPALQTNLEKIKIDFWSIYITFINKTKSSYANKYGLLMHEIHAISPKVLYVIGKTDDSYNALNKIFAISKINYPANKSFYVSDTLLCATTEEERKDLWKVFKYLVNYKDWGNQ